MMEERKFVCKYCSKRFPCGKSLGGHIRTHMTEERNNNLNNADHNTNNNNSDDDDDHRHHNHHLKLFSSGRKRKRDSSSSWPEASGAGGSGSSINNNNNNAIYGLRENPKKTTRFVHIDATLAHEDERFCKECGKGFPSLKALCGHMACHSDKDKGTNNNYNEDQKLVLDSQSDTESCGAPTHPRRSKRMKFKTLNLTTNQPSPMANTNNNGSSSLSEVEQEQEEVARMLMMLSRDSSHKASRFGSVAESSDNNSVVLETAKSSSPETRIVSAKSNNNGKSRNFVSSNGYGALQKKLVKDIKFKCADNSDSGNYVRYGSKTKTKMVDSDVPNYQFNKGYNKSGFEDYDVESRKVLSSKYSEAAARGLDYDRGDGNETSRKFDFRKRGNNYDSPVSSKKQANVSTNYDMYENGRKSWKYESLASEYDGSYDSTEDESDENSTDTDSFPAPKARNNKAANNGKKSSKAKKKVKSKKSREHECPICYRIFRSGQALGGHKRSHFIGGSEENTTLVIKQGAPAVHPCLIDLNLPAPVDD